MCNTSRFIVITFPDFELLIWPYIWLGLFRGSLSNHWPFCSESKQYGNNCNRVSLGKLLEWVALFRNNSEIGLYAGSNTRSNRGQWLNSSSIWKAITFTTWLCLGLGLNLVRFASSMKVESGPRYAKVCNWDIFGIFMSLTLKQPFGSTLVAPLQNIKTAKLWTAEIFYWGNVNDSAACSIAWCLFWPALGCCALPTLVKIWFFNIFG